jgi:hypothetical protein
MTRPGTIASGSCAWIADALRSAWPTVDSVEVRASFDEHAAGVDVDLAVTATAAELIRLGLTTEALVAAIPPCGHLTRGRYHLRRRRDRVRLEVFFVDPDPCAPSEAPIEAVRLACMDAMARAIGPALWTPPAAAEGDR